MFLETDEHNVRFAKSVVFVIRQFPVPLVPHTTQLELHSTSVLAIKANPPLGVQFLFAIKYIYSQFALADHNQLTGFEPFGSCGTEDIHASRRVCVIQVIDIQLVQVQVVSLLPFNHGQYHLSD